MYVLYNLIYELYVQGRAIDSGKGGGGLVGFKLAIKSNNVT